MTDSHRNKRESLGSPLLLSFWQHGYLQPTLYQGGGGAGQQN